MIWKSIKHKDISDAEKISIAKLKNLHWPYGIESQLRWMDANIRLDDVHLMGEEETENGTELRAYSTITNQNVCIDGKHYEFLGVGGVCVDKNIQHSGIGRQLLKVTGEYIEQQEQKGILLCKETLQGFYEKCGWGLLDYRMARVADVGYEQKIMLLKSKCSCNEIVIDRNF